MLLPEDINMHSDWKLITLYAKALMASGVEGASSSGSSSRGAVSVRMGAAAYDDVRCCPQ